MSLIAQTLTFQITFLLRAKNEPLQIIVEQILHKHPTESVHTFLWRVHLVVFYNFSELLVFFQYDAVHISHYQTQDLIIVLVHFSVVIYVAFEHIISYLREVNLNIKNISNLKNITMYKNRYITYEHFWRSHRSSKVISYVLGIYNIYVR